MASRKKAPRTPDLRAILLCGNVTSKAGLPTLHDVYDEILPTRGFPFQRDLWLYCLFTNLQGEYTLEIQLVGGPEAAVLNRAPCAPITESDPRRRIVRTIHFKSLNFVEPGTSSSGYLPMVRFWATPRLRSRRHDEVICIPHSSDPCHDRRRGMDRGALGQGKRRFAAQAAFKGGPNARWSAFRFSIPPQALGDLSADGHMTRHSTRGLNGPSCA